MHEHLQTLEGPARVQDVYRTCSGGEDFNCGTCACILKKMVDTHNNTRTITRLTQNMTRGLDACETADTENL
ncbi:MAG: hypothetical protein KDI13_02070 [Alphaproteobacteria bacterium]|nr:hypothetical protein [Alphaproteobacteria bacterium]